MAYFIDNAQCIDCRLCIDECPDGGISVAFGEDGGHGNSGQYTIASDKCTECIEYNKESKCAFVCPVDCIEVIAPEADEVLWEKWHQNKEH